MNEYQVMTLRNETGTTPKKYYKYILLHIHFVKFEKRQMNL